MIGSSNISTTVVANELGVSTHSVSLLCTSPKINMWSLYKPISVNKSTGLTELDYLDNNFGFTIPSFNSFSSLRTSISDTSKTDWTYNKPTGGSTSPYRLGDFRNYDHYATELFPLTLNGSFGLDTTVNISVPTSISWLTGWREWSEYLGTNMQYLNVGFYVPGIGYYPLTDTNQGLSLADIDNEKLSINLSSSAGFVVGNSYSVYLILTTWDGSSGARVWYTPSDTEGGIWWYLPSSIPARFTVTTAPSPFDKITYRGSGTADIIESTYYQWRNIVIDYYVNVASDYTYGSTGVLSVVGTYSSHYPGTGSSTQAKTIFLFTTSNVAAGLSVHKTLDGADFNLLNSKEDSVNISVLLTLTIGSATYYKNSSITILGTVQ